MTTAKAIASLRATVQAQAGAPAMAAFKASPQYNDAVALQATAVAAVATGNPGGALVALLRASELQPTRAANLRNAATVASAIGQPNQALALLDGAARRETAPPADHPSASAAQGDACPSTLKKASVVIDLKIVKIKVNCEKITLSGKLDSGLPWLSAFGEVSYNPKAGKITVFAGSKGEISGYGLKGDFKSGVYIKVDQDGIADVGWRVGPSASVGAGPLEVSVFKEQSDMSFIGVSNPTFGE